MNLNSEPNKNTEQLQMLCFAIEDRKYGAFCLYKCDDEKEQVIIANKICDNITKSSCIIDIARLSDDKIPDEISKLRALLAGNETAQVVIICNMQKCGEIKGYKEYIEQFNYMRDQMAELRKIWIFGMTKEFAQMLSCTAPDLYSCISNHFDFM